MREDFDTGELLLYFIEKGDTCSMTLTCCMGDKKVKSGQWQKIMVW